jgi:hypothetical protein
LRLEAVSASAQRLKSSRRQHDASIPVHWD